MELGEKKNGFKGKSSLFNSVVLGCSLSAYLAHPEHYDRL
jgi:hypothetical protein